MTTTETDHHLTDVEAGYARVANDRGQTLGKVSREKTGSTRTGTMWIAYYGSRELGMGYTREEAVRIVTDRAAARAARLAQEESA